MCRVHCFRQTQSCQAKAVLRSAKNTYTPPDCPYELQSHGTLLSIYREPRTESTAHECSRCPDRFASLNYWKLWWYHSSPTTTTNTTSAKPCGSSAWHISRPWQRSLMQSIRALRGKLSASSHTVRVTGAYCYQYLPTLVEDLST